MNILGISCYYHDAAAVLLRDGQLIAAAEEERFTRVKHDPRFPRHHGRRSGIPSADRSRLQRHALDRHRGTPDRGEL